jgi:hypothetical protein
MLEADAVHDVAAPSVPTHTSYRPHLVGFNGQIALAREEYVQLFCLDLPGMPSAAFPPLTRIPSIWPQGSVNDSNSIEPLQRV